MIQGLAQEEDSPKNTKFTGEPCNRPSTNAIPISLGKLCQEQSTWGFRFHFPPDICREKWLPPKYALAPSTDANEQTESELVHKWMWVTCPFSLLGLLRQHWHLFLPGLSKSHGWQLSAAGRQLIGRCSIKRLHWFVLLKSSPHLPPPIELWSSRLKCSSMIRLN